MFLNAGVLSLTTLLSDAAYRKSRPCGEQGELNSYPFFPSALAGKDWMGLPERIC
jgi:hypothetical protein